MMIPESQRLSGIQESSTLALNALAKKMRAEGKDVINLTAGEPDFPTPINVIEAAKAALAKGETRYTPNAGLPALREAVAKISSADYGTAISANQVIVSNGAKQALYNLMQALIGPGDEVIVPAPYWLSYPPMVRLAGGHVVECRLNAAEGFQINPATLKALITPRTRMIIVNSPSNPTSTVQSQQAMQGVAELIRGQPIYLVTDDIYQKIIFSPHRWISPYNLGLPESQIIAVNGVSKSYAMTGLRIGWTIADATLVSRLTALQSHSTSAPATPSQWAAVEGLCGPQTEVEKMRQAFAKRRDLVAEELSKIPELHVPTIGGAFYAFPDFSAYLAKTTDVAKRRWRTAAELASYLLSEALIACVPGEDFGAPSHMRISFAVGEKPLTEGLRRLAKALQR